MAARASASVAELGLMLAHRYTAFGSYQGRGDGINVAVEVDVIEDVVEVEPVPERVEDRDTEDESETVAVRVIVAEFESDGIVVAEAD